LWNTAELGLCLRRVGLLSESEAVLRGVVAKRISNGGDDYDFMFDMGDLGRVLMEAGNYEEATTWYEKAFHGLLKTSGWTHWLAVVYCESLGKCYEKQGRYIDGIALFKQALHENQWLEETKHEDYYSFICQLAECQLQEGRYHEAISICKNALHDIAHRKLPQDQDWERVISATLAEGYEQQGQYGDAAVLYERNISKLHGTERWSYERCMYYSRRLGFSYEKLGRYSDALVLYRRSIEEIRDLNGPEDSAVADIHGWIDVLSNQTSNTDGT